MSRPYRRQNRSTSVMGLFFGRLWGLRAKQSENLPVWQDPPVGHDYPGGEVPQNRNTKWCRIALAGYRLTKRERLTRVGVMALRLYDARAQAGVPVPQPNVNKTIRLRVKIQILFPI